MKDRLKENLILIIFAILMIVNILTAPRDYSKQLLEQQQEIIQQNEYIIQAINKLYRLPRKTRDEIREKIREKRELARLFEELWNRL